MNSAAISTLTSGFSSCLPRTSESFAGSLTLQVGTCYLYVSYTFNLKGKFVSLMVSLFHQLLPLRFDVLIVAAADAPILLVLLACAGYSHRNVLHV